MNKFQCPSCIESIATRADNTIKLVVGTQELPPEQMAKLFELHKKEGWFLFKESPLEEKDLEIPEVMPDIKGEKTESQRMRNIIYKIWETTTNRQKPFPDFYKSYMFKLNEMLKERIND